MNINFKQTLAFLIAVLSVLAISSENLADLFGAPMGKAIASAANILNAMIAGVLGVVTSQTAMVKDVAAMPGVEPIKVNAEANATLAAIAMDPAVDNVSALPHDAAAVAETATK